MIIHVCDRCGLTERVGGDVMAQQRVRRTADGDLCSKCEALLEDSKMECTRKFDQEWAKQLKSFDVSVQESEKEDAGGS